MDRQSAETLLPHELLDLDDPWKAVYENFTTIDWTNDLMRDHQRKRRILAKKRTGWSAHFLFALENSQSWILLLLVGVGIGFLAAWIDIAAAWLTDVKGGFCSTEWYLSKAICCTSNHEKDGSCNDFWDWSFAIFGWRRLGVVNWFFYVVFSTVLAAACAVIVCQLSPYAAGSGTPELKTILGGFMIKGFLGFQTFIVKIIGLPLTVASGLAVGKEGPMIHVACCIGNMFPRFFPKYSLNEARKREILSAASAAGVAVAFGAPIGGVLFSLEELSSYFPTKTLLRSYFCALVATVTLQIVDPYRGKRVMYAVTYSRNWHYFELLFFVVLGLFGGLSGAFFIRMNMRVQAYRQTSWLKKYPMLEVVGLGGVTAAFCYFNSFTRVDSSELLEYLFKECTENDFFGICDTNAATSTIVLLIMALCLRVFLSIITFGVKVPAGIFIPSMVWGALFGRALGIMVESYRLTHLDHPLFSSCVPEEPCVTAGMYALLGAIGALGGVTRLTLVMFELTGTLNYVIPCMLTLMVAKLVGDLFGKGGVTDILLRWKRYPYLDVHDDELVGLNAEMVMSKVDELVWFSTDGMDLEYIDQVLEKMDFKGYPVVQSKNDMILVGYISRRNVLHALVELRKMHKLDKNAKVYFAHHSAPSNFTTGSNVQSGTATSVRILPRTSISSPSLFVTAVGPEGVVEGIDLSIYVDMTPATVHPKVPVERVIDIFKKMGPRYVLVEQKGRLCGLITKKDLLTLLYEEEDEMQSSNYAVLSSAASSPEPSEPNSLNLSFESSRPSMGKFKSASEQPQPMTASQVMRARHSRHAAKVRFIASQEDYYNGESTSMEGIVDPLAKLGRGVAEEQDGGSWSWEKLSGSISNLTSNWRGGRGEEEVSIEIDRSPGSNLWKDIVQRKEQRRLRNKFFEEEEEENELEQQPEFRIEEDGDSERRNEGTSSTSYQTDLLFENPFK
ncbi:glycerol ethanol, ferric requiring protein [Nowakowskiella sp. JEL0407]|nr:glycerol ethanol, ferric requiring protein [Nowakowskiella sp. JEL0407]